MKYIITGILILFLIVTIIYFLIPTNSRVKRWGGSTEIKLEKGQRLVNISWKDDDDLWLLTEPMPNNYTPNSKTFYQDSKWGVWEGKIIIIESK